MTQKRKRPNKTDSPRKKVNNMEEAQTIIEKLDQKLSQKEKPVFKDDEKILSILTPHVLNKIQKKANTNEKLKEIDVEVSRFLQNNQLFSTAVLIRDLFKQKKRTAMYKNDLVHELQLVQKVNRSEIDILEEVNLLVQYFPEYFQTCISPTQKIVFKIINFDIKKIKEKLEGKNKI